MYIYEQVKIIEELVLGYAESLSSVEKFDRSGKAFTVLFVLNIINLFIKFVDISQLCLLLDKKS